MRRLSRRQRLAALVLAAVAAALLILDLGGSGLAGAHNGVRGSFGALYRGTDSVLGPVRRFVQGLPGAASNQQRIDALKAENARLRRQLADDAANKATAARLATLRLAARTGGFSVLPAKVVALSPGQGFDWTATIDVGMSSGVRHDQTVTDGYGLVGRVIHADQSSCVVLLAVDPDSGVGVRDLRTGQLGVARGRGTSGFVFTPLDPSADVRVGDRLATGPAGRSSFTTGLAVGTVTAVRSASDGTTSATVSPQSSPTALDVVGVVLDGAGQEASR